jgi:quinol monooxygenase YgiN
MKMLLIVATLSFSASLWASLPCPLIVMAEVKVKPEAVESFKDEVEKILLPTRLERGNRVYRFNQSLVDENNDGSVFFTYEKWAKKEHLEAHLSSAHMQRFFAAVGSYFETGYPKINLLNDVECPL